MAVCVEIRMSQAAASRSREDRNRQTAALVEG
jgi:hypothetical protein